MSEKKGKWEKSADRENARRSRDFPLLVHAGIVPKITPDQQQTRIENWNAQYEQQLRAGNRRAAATEVVYRAMVARIVTPEELAALDKRRTHLPRTPCYGADLFHNAYRHRTGSDPADPKWRPREP